MRIAGQQTVASQHPDAWQALDQPAVHKIAQDSIAQLATFLTSPDAMPAARARVARGDGSSPEAAGIYRIVPVSAAAGDEAAEETPADVPLPPHRPGLARTASLTVAIAR